MNNDREKFVLLENGMLINLHYLQSIGEDHAGIRMNDGRWHAITPKDYQCIIANIYVNYSGDGTPKTSPKVNPLGA